MRSRTRTSLILCLLMAPAIMHAAHAADSPSGRFYCDRTALNVEEKLAIRTHGRVLHDAVTRVRELPNGFEIEVTPDPAVYRALVEYIPLEHRCCPFFDFTVRIGPEGSRLLWTLTGAKGVKAFIKEELSWLFERAQ